MGVEVMEYLLFTGVNVFSGQYCGTPAWEIFVSALPPHRTSAWRFADVSLWEEFCWMSQQNPLYDSSMKCLPLQHCGSQILQKLGEKKQNNILAFAFEPLGLLRLEVQCQLWKYSSLKIQGLVLKEMSENCLPQSHQILDTDTAKEA